MNLPYFNELKNQLRLRGKTEILELPRVSLSKEEEDGLLFELFMLCILSSIAVLVFDAYRNMLIVPTPAVIGDIVIWAVRYKLVGMKLPTRRFLYAPVTCCWFLSIGLPLVLSTFSIQLWAFCLFSLCGWRLLRVMNVLAESYIDYSLESEQLSVPRRRAFKELRSKGFNTQFEPPSHLSNTEALEYRNAWKELRGRNAKTCVLACLLLAGALLFALGCGEFRPTLPVPQMIWLGFLIWILPTLYGIRLGWFSDSSSFEFDWRIALKVLAVWYKSPPEIEQELQVPWSHRSRFGRAGDRVAYLRWNVFLIAFMALQVCLFYSWYQFDRLPIYDIEWMDTYQVSGSRWFHDFTYVSQNVEISALSKLGFFLQVLCLTPLLMFGMFSGIVLPVARAADRLFEGSSALERHHASSIQDREAGA